MEELIKLVKMQNLWNTGAYDVLIESKINACLRDLAVVGIPATEEALSDPLILEAVLTYCTMNLGKPAKDEYDRLKAAYDEMKGQMQTSSQYGMREVTDDIG